MRHLSGTHGTSCLQMTALLTGLGILIPPSLRTEKLKLVHQTHLGMVKCKQRARDVIFWPAMNEDIIMIIRDCSRCVEHQNQQQPEPLKPTKTPNSRYGMVGCDLFEFENNKYVILVDYYSKCIAVMGIQQETTTAVIEAF